MTLNRAFGALVPHSHSANGNLQALHIGRRGFSTKQPRIAQQSVLPPGGAHTALGGHGRDTVATRPHTSGLSPLTQRDS